MVTFEKQKEDERYITYFYYPEDDREKKPGRIIKSRVQRGRPLKRWL